MILVIGLGNPGEKYKNTKHNVAWIILDAIFGDENWQDEKYAHSEILKTNLNGVDFIFAKPQTFMNESGKIISYFVKNFDIKIDDIVVIQDEIDLPFGEIKLSMDSGDAGHNGVKSIMNALGSQKFARIRIGVSIKGEDGKLYKPDVLGNFSIQDIETLKKEISPKVKDKLKEFAK